MNLRRFLSALSAVSVLSASLFGQTLPIFNSRITGTAEVKSGGEIEIESGATLDVQSGATVSFGDPLSLANGGLGVALTDPGADRLPFWDDSEGEIAWLTIGTGLTVSGTTLSAEGFANPMEAAGDLIIGGESGAAAKLAIGTTGQVLTVVDGAPAWDDAAAGAALPAEPTEGDLAYFDGEAWASLAIGTNGQVLVVDTGAPAWDDAPTSGFANPMTTAEDLIVGGTDGAAERLGVGSEGQVLKVVSGAVAWGTDSTGSGSLPGEPSAGDLAYYDGEDWVSLAIGTAAQVLTVNSGATAPEWDDAPSTIGAHTIYIPAGAMLPSTSAGCAELAIVEISAGQPDVATLDFDASTEEYAQFSVAMPKSWDLGTLTVEFLWSHASTDTNFDVTWGAQAVAISNDDALGASYGTAQTVSDTGGTANDLYVSAATGAITAGGTPAAGDVLFFRVYRDADDSGDNLAVDARLHGVRILYTTDAETDD